MITSQFKIETSNFGTYLKVHTYSHSLFNFLNELGMLEDEYRVLTTSSARKQKFVVIYVPTRLAKKMPFILAATACKQINKCLCNTNNLYLVRNRLKNYYCEDFFKKLVSIFGNDKAWNEFEIDAKWKPKFQFVDSKNLCTEPATPYFKFITYKLCSNRYRNVKGSQTTFKTRRLVEMYWNNKTTTFNKRFSLHSVVLCGANITKSMISRFINKPYEKGAQNLKEALVMINANQKLLTKDGLELQKDLNMVRNLAL